MTSSVSIFDKETNLKMAKNDIQKYHLSQYITALVANQYFGISALLIQDVFSMLPITPIPLSPKEIVGALNLRGRIVTAIDMRLKLGLPPRPPEAKFMNIVLSNKGDLYSLVVDQVDEVMALDEMQISPNPASMDINWQKYSKGVFQIKGKLLVIVDPEALLFTTALHQN